MTRTAELANTLTPLRIYALVVAIASGLDIAFGNSLFATLGFEYSGLMGSVLSLVCGLGAIKQLASRPIVGTASEFWGCLGSILIGALAISLIPLLLSLASLPFLPNCALLAGVVFYLEIAIPSALLGAGFGFAIKLIMPKKAVLVYLVFWAGSFVTSLLPGYLNPQIFTYGWQYGYFPGFVWDEALELNAAYAYFRLENLLWLWVALSAGGALRFRSYKKIAYASALVSVVLSAIIYFAHDELHITSSASAVRAELDQTIRIAPDCCIYLKQGSLTQDERTKLVDDIRWFLHDIRDRFELKPDGKPIHIFLYPSSERMFWHVGTQAASIAKPWLGDVHIARSNVLSLKHELAHVLFRQVGTAPFYASWSTGLTEGSAMSVEPRYDGIFTVDQHAARILQLKFATGIEQVMSFTSFASNAPTTSYVLAGSFTRFLLRRYGASRYKQVFRTVDWESAYGTTLGKLEAEWKQSLQGYQSPLSSEDSLHFRYYYERGTVFSTPCLRRLGKLKRQAHSAYEEHAYGRAEQLSWQAYQEGGGVAALVAMVDAMVQQGKIAEAADLMEHAQEARQLKARLSLALRLADMHMMLGEPDQAKPYFDLQQSVKLSSAIFTQSYHDAVIARGVHDSLVRGYFLAQYQVNPARRSLLAERLQAMLAHADTGYNGIKRSLAVRYMIVLTYEAEGDFHEAVRWDPMAHWKLGNNAFASTMSSDDSLAVALMSLHMATLRPGVILREVCPTNYRAAFEELAVETEKRARYLQLTPIP